jgi:hypothetical protein
MNSKIRIAAWEGKILRRPMKFESRAFATDAKAGLLHSLLQFDVGLLRMTLCRQGSGSGFGE